MSWTQEETHVLVRFATEYCVARLRELSKTDQEANQVSSDQVLIDFRATIEGEHDRLNRIYGYKSDEELKRVFIELVFKMM